MSLVLAVVLVVGVTAAFTLLIRTKDVPPPEPVSPTAHLEERKAAIYENLRDLQFEYRVGKLSDEDYQQTKTGLQKELAGVLEQIEQMRPPAGAKPAKPAPPVTAGRKKCPHFRRHIPKRMK